MLSLLSGSIFKFTLLYSNKFHIKILNTLNGQIIKSVTAKIRKKLINKVPDRLI